MGILVAIFAFFAGLFIARQTFTEEQCKVVFVRHESEDEYTPIIRN